VNQIEIIRTLAMSLPVDMILVVKEHPWMVGKRTLGAYSKMLNIPRVRIAEPSLDARSLIQLSDLVAVVTGSIALEAAMLGKPVITFGDCPYNMLPETMIKRAMDIRHIQILIRDMLDNYLSDDKALEAYVSAVFDTSCGVNLYSVLLGKKNVHVENEGVYGSEIEKMANHVAGIINNSTDTAVQGAAIW
jgi:CDP-glycerol glycerophosphotransferase (TagB/SpsB family)